VPAPQPKGVIIRPCRPGDEKAMAALFDQDYRDWFARPPMRPTRVHESRTVFVALRGRKPVGYLEARLDAKQARIWQHAAVDKDRERVARALLDHCHREMRARGVREMRAHWPTQGDACDLERAGYARRQSGGVSMFAVLDLPRFLAEAAPLWERRLGKIEWEGTLAFQGQRLRASLEFTGGRATACDRVPRRPDVRLTGSDATLTRILAGIVSPYEAYLQRDLAVRPGLNGPVRRLLESLLPRMSSYDSYR